MGKIASKFSSHSTLHTPFIPLLQQPTSTNMNNNNNNNPTPTQASTSTLPPIWSKRISYAQLVLHVITIFLSLVLFVPFIGSFLEFETLEWLYTTVLRCALIALILTLVRKHYPISVSMLYVQQLFMDEHSHFLLFAFLMYGAGYSYSSTSILLPVILLPFVARSIIFVCGASLQLLPQFLPTAAPLVQPYAQFVIQNVPTISRTNALLEVSAGILSIFSLITRQASILQVILVWQYLRARYALSADSKFAFKKVHDKIDGYINTPSVPAPIRKTWTTVCNLLHSLGDQQALAQRQSALPSCTVM